MSDSKPRRPSRRKVKWRALPPLLHGSEALQGVRILEEFPNELGVLFWRSLRNVLLWASAAPRKRAALFAPEAADQRRADLRVLELDPVLEGPLRVIANLLADPSSTSPQSLVQACGAISGWAEARAARATALGFAQAAALASPLNAAAAHAAGRRARLAGEYVRAESWLRHALVLARQSGDWRSYALAWTGLGNVLFARGNLAGARRAQLRAVRAARRRRFRDIEAMGLHALFEIANNMQRAEEAEAWASAALATYSPDHPLVPALVHDIAYFWLEHGYFARALAIFQALRPRFPEAREQLLLAASTARAAGGAGEVEIFWQAWEEVHARIGDAVAQKDAASLLDVARGAASLGLEQQAQETAERALWIAEQLGEGKVRLETEAFLEALRHERHAAALPPVPGPHPPTPANELAEKILRSLGANV